MARQSFRGAGGAGAVVLPYEHAAAAGEYEVTASSQSVLTDGSRSVERALAIVASGVLVAVGVFVAGWTLTG
jgi:hypothetical protein